MVPLDQPGQLPEGPPAVEKRPEWSRRLREEIRQDLVKVLAGTVKEGALARISQCAMERRLLLTGAKPVQQLSLRLVAARADHGGNDMV